MLKSLISDLPYIKITPYSIVSKGEFTDSVYRFISAKVINNSVDKQNNYITLNKGRKDGINPTRASLIQMELWVLLLMFQNHTRLVFRY